MTADSLLTAFALPPETRVDQRVPKKLLLEHGAPTVGDRRLVQEAIDALGWAAVLRPATVGLPGYRDEVREYAELSVLTAMLRQGLRPAQVARLTELVHRAVPYPVALVTSADDGTATLSLAHKRRSATGGAAVIAELPVVAATLGPGALSDAEARFLTALASCTALAADLFALYQGWMNRVTALDTARVTGRWAVPATPADAAARRQILDEHARLRREATGVRAAAGRERQLARRVELNGQLRRLDVRLAELAHAL